MQFKVRSLKCSVQFDLSFEYRRHKSSWRDDLYVKNGKRAQARVQYHSRADHSQYEKATYQNKDTIPSSHVKAGRAAGRKFHGYTLAALEASSVLLLRSNTQLRIRLVD